MLPVDELARDERFERIKVEDVVFDPRNAVVRENDRQAGSASRTRKPPTPPAA